MEIGKPVKVHEIVPDKLPAETPLAPREKNPQKKEEKVRETIKK